MRLRQIEIFYHVYRTQSISGAARDLNVSQPSVSKVLRHAEDQLGIELFLRRKGRLVPTQAAHELFAEAEDIYNRLSMFNRSLENIARRRGGHLRLGVLPSLSLSVGPDVIAQLRSDDPLLSFEFTTLHTSELAHALLEKRVDLAIGFNRPDDERLVCEDLGAGAMVLVSGQPLECGASGRVLDSIADADFISMRESGPLGALVIRELDKRAIEPNEIVWAHTYHVALSLVRKEVGLAITDQFTAYSHLGAGLQRYRLDELPQFPIFGIALRYHPDAELIARAMSSARDCIGRLCAGIEAMQPPKA